MIEILKAANKAIEESKAFIMVTILGVEGSFPQKIGTKMLIFNDRSTVGSIGGGSLEAQAIDFALSYWGFKEAIIQKFVLVQDEQNIAEVQLLFEPFSPPNRLYIFGAGHVGSSVAKLSEFTGFKTILIDDRKELLQGINIPNVEKKYVTSLDDFDTDLFDESTLVLISTRSHSTDFLVLSKVINSKAGYIGLLGSKKKKENFFKKLKEKGISEKELLRINVPVGLDIGAKTAKEIAVSIIAQMIKWKYSNN